MHIALGNINIDQASKDRLIILICLQVAYMQIKLDAAANWF